MELTSLAKDHKVYQIGEICDNYPISITPAGEYPPVTTGAEQRTAPSYQFDSNAI